MDKLEAMEMLALQLTPYRALRYEDLVAFIESQGNSFEVTAPSGVQYYGEVQAFWDSRRGGDVRVLGSIDDGKSLWHTFVPLCDSFIMAPDGSFVGE